MSQNAYPVVSETPWGPARRKLLGKSRESSELPAPEPGTVLVFDTPTGLVTMPERRHLGGREDIVVNSVAVIVVDVRPRTITVPVPVPSSSPADDFTILVEFRCTVDAPEVVAATGCKDVVPLLRSQLLHDRELGSVGIAYSVSQINHVRDVANRRVRAACELRPPRLEGMTVRLVGVRVTSPKDLVDYARKMRDEQWQQDLVSLRGVGEDNEAARLKKVFEDGPAAVAAMALKRGELDLEQATQREYADARAKREQLINLFNSLPEAYRDTMAIDADRIINSVFDGLLGPTPAAPAMGVQQVPELGPPDPDDGEYGAAHGSADQREQP